MTIVVPYPPSSSSTWPASSSSAFSAQLPEHIIHKVASRIRSARRVVVVCGAGISTAAAIPDFRSAEGLFGGGRGKGKTKVKELFHVNCLGVSLSLKGFAASTEQD